MRQEQIVSPTPPGAGRFRDWVWPDPGNLDGNPTPFVGDRIGATLAGSSPVATSIGFGGGTTTLSATVAGIDCAQLLSTAGAGIGYRFDSSMMAHIKTSLNAIPFPCDDETCFRVIVNMALGLTPTPGTDYGYYLTTANTNGRVLADAAVGFGFQIVDGNVVNFVTRGGLGLISIALTAAPFDTTAFHAYEMRVTSATAIAQASLAILIDNVPVASVPATVTGWGPGSALPPSVLFGGTRAGFRVGVYNTSGIINGLFVQKIRFMSAPTMDATL